MLLGTASRAVVMWLWRALSGFAAPGGCCCLAPVRVPWLWPAACHSGVPPGPTWCAAHCPVRSLSVLWLAFLTPWCLSPPGGLSPPALLGGRAGHVEAGQEPGSLCLPLAPAEAGALGLLRVVAVLGPAMGLSLAGPSGIGLGLLALWCLACEDPVTDASSFPYCPSFDGGPSRCTGAVLCGRRHRPFRVAGRHARVPCVCACACFLGKVGRAGLSGAFWCVSPFPVAVLGAPFVCSAPSWLGVPCLWLLLCLFVFFSFLFAPPLSLAFRVFWPWVPWALACCAPPPLLFFSTPFCFSLPCFFFFLPVLVFVFFLFSPSSVFFFAVRCTRHRGRHNTGAGNHQRARKGKNQGPWRRGRGRNGGHQGAHTGRACHNGGTSTAPPPADTARPPETHACQHTPPKQGPDTVRTAPAHAHRLPDPAQEKEGIPTRGEGATFTEGAAENTAAQPTTTPSPPGGDPGHRKGHHTGARRGRGHGRSTQG